MTEMESEQKKIVDAKKTEKKKGERKSWEEKDDICLIKEVLEREHLLFGEIKGSGGKSIQRKRQDAWQDVTDILNSYDFLPYLFIHRPRSIAIKNIV